MYHRIKSLLPAFENRQFLCCSLLMHCFEIAVAVEMQTVIYLDFNYSFCDCSDVNLKEQLYNRGDLTAATKPLIYNMYHHDFCSRFLFECCTALCAAGVGSAASGAISIKRILIAGAAAVASLSCQIHPFCKVRGVQWLWWDRAAAPPCSVCPWQPAQEHEAVVLS